MGMSMCRNDRSFSIDRDVRVMIGTCAAGACPAAIGSRVVQVRERDQEQALAATLTFEVPVGVAE